MDGSNKKVDSGLMREMSQTLGLSLKRQSFHENSELKGRQKSLLVGKQNEGFLLSQGRN